MGHFLTVRPVISAEIAEITEIIPSLAPYGLEKDARVEPIILNRLRASFLGIFSGKSVKSGIAWISGSLRKASSDTRPREQCQIDPSNFPSHLGSRVSLSVTINDIPEQDSQRG